MIRKDDILRATDKGIHVFRHYLGKDFKVGKNFLNPFYRDTKASCNIYYDRKAGVFKMKDFGNEEYSGDCFELVDRLNGLDCAIRKISWKLCGLSTGTCIWGCQRMIT